MKIPWRVGAVVCAVALVCAFAIAATRIAEEPTQEKPPITPHEVFLVLSPEQVENIAREIAGVLDYSPEETEAYVESVLALSKIPPNELILRLKLDCLEET